MCSDQTVDAAVFGRLRLTVGGLHARRKRMHVIGETCVLGDGPGGPSSGRFFMVSARDARDVAVTGRVDEMSSTAAMVPARPLLPSTGARRAAWTRRYIRRLILADAITAVVAVAFALTIRDFSFDPWKQTVLLVGAGLAWPLVIALNHGYDRGRIGVGSDELQAIIRALVLAVDCVPSPVPSSRSSASSPSPASRSLWRLLPASQCVMARENC